MTQAKKTEEDLGTITDELNQLKDDYLKVCQDSEELSTKCFNLEQEKEKLRGRANQTRNEIVDNYESERNFAEDKLINYQINMKVKEE